MKFHEKLYDLRRKAGMTQQDLAEKLNVSRQAVSRWEMGTAMPEIDNLVAISDVLGASLDELLRDREEQAETETAEPPEKGPRYWDFVPKKWWIFAVAVLVLRLIPSLFMIALLSDPGGNVMAIASWITVINVLQGISVALLIGCFVLALVRWLNARRK